MLPGWLQIEIAFIPVAISLVAGMVWIIRLEGRIKHLDSFWDQMFKLTKEALNTRDDNAKERDLEMKRDVAEMKRDIASINTNVAVLMDDRERKD